MDLKTFMPAILNSQGAVVGMAGGTQADHEEAEREAQRQREAQGPPVAMEHEICALLNAPAYNEIDPTSPWVAIRAAGFPKPFACEILSDPITRDNKFGECKWYRRDVRAWLEAFDAIGQMIVPPAKRHRFFR